MRVLAKEMWERQICLAFSDAKVGEEETKP